MEALISKNNLTTRYVECLATCHSVSLLDDLKIGDPLDIKMFESTGWILDETNTNNKSMFEEARVYSEEAQSQNYILVIKKRFDFNSDVMRMSSIVRCLKTNAVYAYVKGSPERIQELCQKNTIPSDFD